VMLHAQTISALMVDTPSVSQLSQVISQSIAPAFMLGAVSGFIAVLVTRLNRIIDRCRMFSEGEGNGGPALHGVDLRKLNARANLINQALFWAVASALTTILLMVLAFGNAFFDVPHEKGAAALFVLALLLFAGSLINFAREIRIAIKDPNNFD
jgi:hypothetical protein